MKNNIFLYAAVISAIYVLIKIIEIQFIEKEQLNIKLLIRDMLIVFFSVITGYYMVDQLTPMMYGIKDVKSVIHPPAFTDAPSF